MSGMVTSASARPGTGDEGDSRIEVRLVREHRLAVHNRPARDALPEGGARAHDLVLPLGARKHGDQLVARVVGLVDLERVVRDEVVERVGDAVEQRVEALLGEHVVEDLGQPPVRLDQRIRLPNAAVRGRPGRVLRDVLQRHVLAIGSPDKALEKEQGKPLVPSPGAPGR